MDEGELDKSESASPFKLRRAREKGQVARGIDLGFVTALCAFIAFAWIFGAPLAIAFAEASALTLAGSGTLGSAPERLLDQAGVLFFAAFRPVLILALITFLTVGFFEFLQVGPVFSVQILKPDFSRINPVQGLKRLFNVRMLVESIKSVVKLAVYGSITWIVIRNAFDDNRSVIVDGNALLILCASTGFRLILFYALSALGFAVIDQMLARREFAKKMRMSKRELKREHRDREGDPRLKSRRKEFHNEFLKIAASLRSVRAADVILTNPTHYAIALRYSGDSMSAPMIVARGSGILAERIRRIGFTYGVLVIRSPELARALFKTRILEGEIPDKLYPAVADVYRRFDLVGRRAY